MFVLVGLGNPGSRYSLTRHNLGFLVLERIAQIQGWNFRERGHKALTAQGNVAGVTLLLVKPQTYMNLSGESVGPLMKALGLGKENLALICDDLDLPVGKIRIRPQGGHGGHRGLRSVFEFMGTNEIPRIRLGIGRPHPGMEVPDYVLTPFSLEEIPLVRQQVDRAAEAALLMSQKGVAEAMNAYNGDPPGKD